MNKPDLTDAERFGQCRLACSRCTGGCVRGAGHALKDFYGHICADCTMQMEVMA